VLSDDRIVYYSINGKVDICDWEGKHIFEIDLPLTTGFSREMANSWDSNDLVISYTSRRAY